jgi:hypothetical protein
MARVSRGDNGYSRAMQFSLFPVHDGGVSPFPPARGKAGMGGKRSRVLAAKLFTPHPNPLTRGGFLKMR